VTLRQNTPGWWLKGLQPALAVVAALLLAGSVEAAAPPPPAPKAAPLFEFRTVPVNMAQVVVGASTAPRTGQLGAAAAVFAGDHPHVKAWDLKNPLTSRHSRITIGATTLVLNGFRCGPGAPGVGLGPALAELVTLRWGDFLECWTLQNTDVFRPLPDRWLRHVEDNKGLFIGTPEASVYAFVLNRAWFTSPKAFASAVRPDITETHLDEDPERYRGKVVRVEGRLVRINRHDPPWEARQGAVSDLYEAWIFPANPGASPCCVLFVEWPTGLPRDVLGKQKLNRVITVRLDGYFFKKYRYQGARGQNNVRFAPLVIGHTLSILPLPVAEGVETKAWGRSLVLGFLVVFAALLFGVIGLTCWYRRSDNDIRRRLLRARTPEFILPPPDAMPIASLVTAGRPTFGPATAPPRSNRSPGRIDRPREAGGEDSAGRPSDEGAGS
jgi:hypothetical protein